MPGFDGTGPRGFGPITGGCRVYYVLKAPIAHDEPVTGFAGLSGRPVSFSQGGSMSDLVGLGLASTVGVPFDVDKDYDERKEQYRLGGEIVTTREITQTAEGDKNGLWTAILAAAVMIGALQ